MKSAICMFVFAAAVLPAPRARHREVLEFEGKPVHPALVELLLTNVADRGPVATAVELDSGMVSNRAHEEVELRDGWVSCPLEGGGTMRYRTLGRTPGGTYVVETSWNGGGSGWFGDLLFLRLEREEFLEQGKTRSRTVLKCTGEFGLGDRDDGVVTVMGARVVVSASRYRAAGVGIDVE